MINITVMYSCHLCDVRDVKLSVPARESAQNVVQWVEGVIALIGRHHHSQHPRCRARKLHDLKIPIDNAEYIGGPPVM